MARTDGMGQLGHLWRTCTPPNSTVCTAALNAPWPSATPRQARGSQTGETTCGKSRAKLTISRLDEIFYPGFLSVKGCKVDILTMFGAQFALMVQDRSLKRGEAPVWGVVSSDTN